MEPGSMVLRREHREQIEKAVADWQTRTTGKVPEGYLEFTLGNMAAKRLKDKDPERVQRPQLAEVVTNNLRYLVDNFAVPGNPEFKPLEKEELINNFHLETDPKVPRPLGKSRASPVRSFNRAPTPPVKKMKILEETNAPEDEAIARNKFEQSRLEQILQKAVHNLMRCKFSKGKTKSKPFKGLGFPFDNPFAVRIDRQSGVLPPDYFDLISEPCDLSKVKDNVDIGFYKSFSDFERDIKLIISNSRKYHNLPKTKMYRATTMFEEEASKILSQAKQQLMN